jgi:hypothetical protein
MQDAMQRQNLEDDDKFFDVKEGSQTNVIGNVDENMDGDILPFNAGH